MSEREIQDAHARILQLEEVLAREREEHQRTLEHSRWWEKRAKRNYRKLQRVLEVVEDL